MRTTRDASDQRLLPITLTTSTRASLVSDSSRACARSRTEGLVLHGTLPASAGRSICARRGVLFSRREPSNHTPGIPVAVSSFVSASHRLRAHLRRGQDRFSPTARDGDEDSTTRDTFHRRVIAPSVTVPLRPVTRGALFPARWLTATRRFSAALHARLPSASSAFYRGLRARRSPFARPRPRELVVRLEEDHVSRFSGPGAAHRLLQHIHDARAHPCERLILVRE